MMMFRAAYAPPAHRRASCAAYEIAARPKTFRGTSLAAYAPSAHRRVSCAAYEIAARYSELKFLAGAEAVGADCECAGFKFFADF